MRETEVEVYTERDQKNLVNRSFHSHTGGYLLNKDGDRGLSALSMTMKRLGSNCSLAWDVQVAAFVLAENESDVLAITNHGRNGEGIKSIPKTQKTMWEHTLRRPQDWPLYGVASKDSANDLTTDERDRLWETIGEVAALEANYGDERILANWEREAAIQRHYPDKLVLSGIESNLRLDGSVDSLLVHDLRCRVHVMSLHTDYSTRLFDTFQRDPLAHSDFLIEAIHTHQPHIMAHIGYKCRRDEDPIEESATPFRRHMDLAVIAKACMVTNTALEINYSHLYYDTVKNLVNPDTFPESSDEWKIRATELFELTPLLNDPEAMAKLTSAIERGLLLVINNDRHHLPRPDAIAGRYQAIMEMFSHWLRQRMLEYKISPEQVINTWSIDQLRNFFVAR